jgi:hypothetical protein
MYSCSETVSNPEFNAAVSQISSVNNGDSPLDYIEEIPENWADTSKRCLKKRVEECTFYGCVNIMVLQQSS